jgi:pyroglutamyl-peptidase
LKVILAGFTPFASLQMNPSQIIVEEFVQRHRLRNDVEIKGQILQTIYESAAFDITASIRSLRPNIILLFGVAADLEELRIERFALNIDDCPDADNSGEVRTGQPIIQDGPLGYRATIPVDALCRHLNEERLPARASNHAGTYVCNHVFYRARHEVETLHLAALCGFIHVPMPSHMPKGTGPQQRYSIYDLLRAVEVCVDYLISVLNK